MESKKESWRKEGHIDENGIVYTKGSYVLKLMGYSNGDSVSGGVELSDRFQELIRTTNWNTLTQEDYLNHVNNLRKSK
jgi:hypothetical protein